MVRRFDPLILALLVVSLGANLYLYRLYATARGPQRPVTKLLAAGDRVPVLEGKYLDGSVAREPFADRVVLYFFSPACSWCERNLANAKAVAAGAGSRYKFVAVSTMDSGVKEYMLQRGLDWTTVGNVTEANLMGYKIPGTPMTALIDAGGVVLGAWGGAYSGTVAKEIESSLGVALPGLVELK